MGDNGVLITGDDKGSWNKQLESTMVGNYL